MGKLTLTTLTGHRAKAMQQLSAIPTTVFLTGFNMKLGLRVAHLKSMLGLALMLLPFAHLLKQKHKKAVYNFTVLLLPTMAVILGATAIGWRNCNLSIMKVYFGSYNNAIKLMQANG